MTEQGSTDATGTRVAEELRGLLDGLAERAQPWLNQVREQQAEGHSPSSCGWCPLCAMISLARGDRPELAERLATHTLGLLGTLRAAMEPDTDARPNGAGSGESGNGHAGHGPGAGAEPGSAADEPVAPPTVQHITVERFDQN